MTIRLVEWTGVYSGQLVGISLPRHDPTFLDLPLQENLEAAKVSARCGLLIIDLTSGDVVEWMQTEEPIRELYDVLVLQGLAGFRIDGFIGQPCVDNSSRSSLLN